MNSAESLRLKHEILLLNLQARRLAYTDPVEREAIPGLDAPRSATMRFIVKHPALCMWVVSECLPFVLKTFLGGSGERCASALRADHRRREAD